ncbi:tyrosinase central domain protein [Aspergillus heteromorphus CBS 117.55]|uniref:Tyrosinase central domain protein n=1 Tax=Aspergillus heteromorphus CBS 117.55 TaxID=1448321 RepID=A0A317V4A3_9EURO|nr:tyrosinase central domain protein [Aspergillus heteromorphus CBS 117.55]PWY67908.1 tyrosinase central domain protein [Aspergillus heteromorphus CBS 117.55]
MRLLVGLLLTIVVALAAPQPRCRPEQTTVRRDWADLSKQQRTDFIDAVWCLRRLPSTLPNDQYPGVRDRYDDFVATHINYTLVIHNNGLFLPWHRELSYLFEKALQDECGYKGGLPYWNWPSFTSNLSASPVFDGSDTSLSGDGLPDPTAPLASPPCPENVACSPGHGGGCVHSGPFTNWTIHMGPISLSDVKSYAPLPSNAWTYNPRCLTRSFSESYLLAQNTHQFLDAMMATTNIIDFLEYMDPSGEGYFGAHGSGHRAVGSTMSDVFAAAQDPSFFLHHSMVDRMWTIWQGKDPATRTNALNGTTIIYDPPGSPDVTLDTVAEWGVVGRARKLREVMDTTAYDYCYRYE